MDHDPAQRDTPVVLVVETPIHGLPSLVERLAATGCEARAVGEQAVFAQWKQAAPGMVLLDVSSLGGQNAHDMCRRLKSDRRGRFVPVLLAVANPDEEALTLAYEVGATDVVRRSDPVAAWLARMRFHVLANRRMQSLAERNTRLQQEITQRQAHDEHLQRSLDRAVVSGQGNRVRFCTQPAQRLLDRFFPEHRTPGALPPELAAWLADGAHAPWRATRDGGQLEVTRQADPLAAPADGSYLLALAVDLPSATNDGPASLARLGLTPREAEVLYWIAHGKTNPETGVILKTAPNTIKKHMQNIMLKLGVENRLAAASRALEVIGLSWSQRRRGAKEAFPCHRSVPS